MSVASFLQRTRDAARVGVATLVAVSALSSAVSAEPAADAQHGVAALLKQSAGAWNRGDLDTFMQTYENSPRTQYVSATGVVHGYAAIRARYAGHYRPGHMGTLSVSDLDVRPLGADYAVAVARWHLARSAAAGGNVSGIFSLVVHRNAAGWHIITDHTP